MEARALDKDSKTKVVEEISKALIDQYVFLDVAQKCAARIRSKLDAGAFDGITDSTAFATALTEELQGISKDKHMRVRVIRDRRD